MFQFDGEQTCVPNMLLVGQSKRNKKRKIEDGAPLSSMPGAELVPLHVPKMLQIPMIIASSSMMTLQGIKAPLPAQRQAGSPSRMAAPNSNFGDAEKGGLDGGAPTDQTTNANSGCQNCPFGGEISLAGSSTISMINWNGDVFSIPSHQLK